MTLSPEREAALLAVVPSDAVSLLDEDGLVREVTSTVEQVLGYTPEQYRAHEPLDLIHPSDQAMLVRNWRDLMLEPGRRSIVEARSRHLDGTYRWVELVQVNRFDDPEFGGMVSGFTDITARRGTVPQPTFEHLIEASPDVMGTIGLDGTITWISTAIHEMLGREAEDMIGRPAWDFIHPDDVDAATERLSQALDRIDSVNPIAVRVSDVDGSWVPVEIAGGSMRDANGGVAGLIVNIRDIRWRTDAVDALRASELLFRTLAQSSPIGIYHATVDEGLRLRQRPVVRDHRPVARGSPWQRVGQDGPPRRHQRGRARPRAHADGGTSRHHRVPGGPRRRRPAVGAGAERSAPPGRRRPGRHASAPSTTSPGDGRPRASGSA